MNSVTGLASAAYKHYFGGGDVAGRRCCSSRKPKRGGRATRKLRAPSSPWSTFHLLVLPAVKLSGNSVEAAHRYARSNPGTVGAVAGAAEGDRERVLRVGESSGKKFRAVCLHHGGCCFPGSLRGVRGAGNFSGTPCGWCSVSTSPRPTGLALLREGWNCALFV